MKYALLNNFAHTLAGSLAASTVNAEESMTLSGGGDVLGPLITTGVTHALLTLVELNADNEEIGWEVVEVKALVSGNEFTVLRGQDGTGAKAWSSGVPVEMRVTTKLIQALTFTDDLPAPVDTSNFLTPDDPNPQFWGGVFKSDAHTAGKKLVIGDDGYVQTGDIAGEFNICCVGPMIYNYADWTTSFGHGINVQGFGGVAVGAPINESGAGIFESYGIYLGMDDEGLGIYDTYAVLVGYNAQVNYPYGGAYGARANSNLAGGLHMTMIPYLGADDNDGTWSAPVIAGRPTQLDRVANQVVLASPIMSLAAVADFDFDMPAGYLVFIDSIDIVVVNSTTPGGTPAVSVGTAVGTPANLLAATTVTDLTVGARQKQAPLLDSGQPSLHASVTTAGTGTIEARVIVRGYAVEA